MKAGFIDAGTVTAGTVLKPEVCIIGSGAGGATAAAVLAAAGREVLVVEEGAHRTRADFNMREDVAFETLYQEGGLRTSADQGIAVLQGRAVGGTTVINWTTCFRTPDHVVEHWRVHHALGGFSAADLRPHFAAVEERLHIAEIPLADSNRNNLLLHRGLSDLGLDPRPTRRNVKRCARTGYCGLGCPIDAKQSMLVTHLPDAIAGGATVLHHLRVERLETAAGQVAAAHALVLGADGQTPTGASVRIEARRFLLCAGAINSPAVLLRSGLGGGAVGRRTFLHPVAGAAGVYRDPVNPFYGAPQSVACHSLADRGGEAGLFLEASPLQPMLAAMALPGFGEGHGQRMRDLSHTSAHIALAIDGFDPSESGGTVSVHPSGMARLDYPVPQRIWRALREGVRVLLKANLSAGAEVVFAFSDPVMEIRRESDLGRLDDVKFETASVQLFSAHVMGGCAMGDDPAHAVVRSEDLRHHGLGNLHVVDGSVLPTSLGVNPQLSIYGIARLAATRMHAGWS